jgi:23S rRNA pseudouridine2605 synthase
MHPKNNISKRYLAKIEGILDKTAIDKLKNGVLVLNRKVNIVDFKIKKKDSVKNHSLIEITIIEGRNHIVKNIFKTLGYPVIKLSRIQYGFLTVDGLASGEYRMLTPKEVKQFYGTKK